MRGKSGRKRECEDIADFLRRELKHLKQIFGRGYELEVIWAPNENSNLSGEVKGTRLYIYEPDREKALQTLVHEFLDYLISRIIEPYRDVTNKLISLINEYAYQRKDIKAPTLHFCIMRVENPFEPYKFRASKPLDIALEYLNRYAVGRKVLLDPFAGSGVFIYAGLLAGMKVIYNDLNPYALFLARNAIRPFDENELVKAWNRILDRLLDKDIVGISNGRKIVKIRKGTSVREAVEWFYETGNGEIAEYYIWDTEFGIPVEKVEGKKDKRLEILISELFRERLIDGKKYYVFSQREVSERWQELFDVDPEAWLSQVKKTENRRRTASVVTSFAGSLIKSKNAVRLRRYPVLKKVGGRLEKIDSFDVNKIKEIEMLEYPFPDLIPNTPLAYKYERIEEGERKTLWKPFRQLRWRSVLVPEEPLKTLEEDEKIPLVKHFFTKRNLIALSIILWSIMKEPFDIREQLYLVLAAKLHMLPKFDRAGDYGRWASGYYQVLDDFKENNVLLQLEEGFSEVIKSKRIIWSHFNSNLINMFYDETWDPEEFLSYIADETRKNVLWLRKDARELDKIFHNRRIVGVVFTDPPYKGKDESVQYFEVCTLYVSILSLDQEWAKRYGTNDWWQKEVIDNDRQGKTFETYIDALAECLSSVNRIVKESGIWIVTYHSPSPEVWDSIRHVFRRIGLNIPPYQEIQSHAVRRGQTMYTERYGTIGKDAYIVLSRDREGIAPPKRITEKEFMTLTFKALKKELQGNGGIVTWDAFGRIVGEILMKYGAPVERSSDIREIFDKYTIELAPGYRIFDRDALGDELWNEVYHNIPIKTLLLKCLTLYGESKQRIPREEIIYRLLPKLNGRVKSELDART